MNSIEQHLADRLLAAARRLEEMKSDGSPYNLVDSQEFTVNRLLSETRLYYFRFFHLVRQDMESGIDRAAAERRAADRLLMTETKQ